MEKLSIHPNQPSSVKNSGHSKAVQKNFPLKSSKPPKIIGSPHYNDKMSKTTGYKNLKPMSLHFAASP